MKERKLFDNPKVSIYTDIAYEPAIYQDNVKHISISGVQEKLLAVVDDDKLRLVKEGEQSTYIIKPTPHNPGLLNLNDMPANEYLTMQIASIVYNIETPAFGMVSLANNHWAYIIRRFDIQNGEKLGQEDVCTLLSRSAKIHGSDYKYQGSYLEIAKVIQQASPLWRFDVAKLVSQVIFNYLFSNGDAHLKNFSLLLHNGQYSLAPAYDLLNTSLHIADSDFALDKGLGLPIKLTTETYDRTGHPTCADFRNFALLCGLTQKQTDAIIAPYLKEHSRISELCEKSLLASKCKRMYMRSYKEKMQRFLREK